MKGLAVNVTTKKQYQELLVILEKIGYLWGSGHRPTDDIAKNYFNDYNTNMCVSLYVGKNNKKSLSYGSRESNLNQIPPVKIISFDEFREKYDPDYICNKRLIAAIKKATS